MSAAFTFHKASIQDLKQLQDISRVTFTEAFAESNSEENLRQFFEEKLNEEVLRKELMTPESIFYLAMQENKIAGFLKVNFAAAQTELQQEDGVELERIYILKAFYGKGLGQQLLDMAIRIAQQKNAKFLWLGVWEHNERALRFYQRNGFIAFDTHVFMVGPDKQTDIMMKLGLPALPLPQL